MSPTSKQIDAYLRDHALPTIARAGYMVQGVFAVKEDDVPFVYTVGLSTRGWPELVLVGLDCQDGGWMVNRIVEHFENTRTAPVVGDMPDFFGKTYPFRLRECTTRDPGFPLSVAREIYPDVTALQVLVPDDQHRYPGDEGCEFVWQKVLAAP